jgi:hypothetical protein
MLPAFLVSGQLARESGQSPAFDLGAAVGKPLHLTLGITRIIEKESLKVSISGSADGETWEPILSLPKKFYCGIYDATLDLRSWPVVRYLRAEWQMGRWGPREQMPLFDFFIKAEEMRTSTAAA